MNFQPLRDLLIRFQQGDANLEQTLTDLTRIASPVTATTSDAHIDLDRRKRCGFPEVVFCEGKSTDSVVEILKALHDHGENGFATRISPEQAAAVISHFANANYNPVARTVRLPETRKQKLCGQVTVITAGTSDRPIGEEAVETLHWMGCEVDSIVDVGVAGPHRLQEQRDRFSNADAVVVVAGMEGALPSVVGGCVDCPVIAVPTSVGYGASFGGVAALLGMLNSCASNVTVVNIDSGYKGGYVAGLIARKIAAGRISE